MCTCSTLLSACCVVLNYCRSPSSSLCSSFRSDYDANRNCVNVIIVLLPPSKTSQRPYRFSLSLSSIDSHSLSLVHFVRHSCHSILSNAIYKELILTFCVRKFFSVLFSALCKNVHKSSLYGFLLGYRVLSLVPICSFASFNFCEMRNDLDNKGIISLRVLIGGKLDEMR